MSYLIFYSYRKLTNNPERLLQKYLLELTLNDLKQNWNEIILRFGIPEYVWIETLQNWDIFRL